VQLRKLQEELDLVRAQNRQAHAGNEILAGIIENSRDAIMATASNGEIVSWNRMAEQIFGYSAGEALGQPLSAFLETEGVACPGTPHRAVIVNRRTGAQTEAVLSFAPIRDATGKPKGTAVTAEVAQIPLNSVP
jgi:PAS domain-containing protein